MLGLKYNKISVYKKRTKAESDNRLLIKQDYEKKKTSFIRFFNYQYLDN